MSYIIDLDMETAAKVVARDRTHGDYLAGRDILRRVRMSLS
jgi:hypothetical protein